MHEEDHIVRLPYLTCNELLVATPIVSQVWLLEDVVYRDRLNERVWYAVGGLVGDHEKIEARFATCRIDTLRIVPTCDAETKTFQVHRIGL